LRLKIRKKLYYITYNRRLRKLIVEVI
ncbi:hypothetical protein MPH_13340, partial [Macrophomina phaseolina MS6]